MSVLFFLCCISEVIYDISHDVVPPVIQWLFIYRVTNHLEHPTHCRTKFRNLRARHTAIHQVCFGCIFFFFFDKVYKLIKVSALFAASDTKRGRREFLPLPNNINSFRVIKPPTCWVFTSINHPRILVAVDVMDGWEGVCGGGLRREKH